MAAVAALAAGGLVLVGVGCNASAARAERWLEADGHPGALCVSNGRDRASCVVAGAAGSGAVRFACLVTNSAGCASESQVMCQPVAPAPGEAP